MSDYKKAVNVLLKAKADIAAILTAPEDQFHLLHITNNLQKQADRLGMVTGTQMDSAPVAVNKMKRATSIAGEKIVRPEAVKPADLQPQDERVAILKGKIKDTYARFLTTETKELLKYEQAVIRGVAKKVHLPYSKEDVPKITSKYIDSIKEAIITEEAELTKTIEATQEKINGLNEARQTAEADLKEATESGDAELIEAAQTAHATALKNFNEAVDVLNSLNEKKHA